ncbi:CBS domain-containing protein [Streptomyces samsunensis]|uniref:CBS domain-containing protein n=4 Tax=Streptomyces TaxID=1883 RepID=A0ABX6W8U4_STRMQ|nr:MULTISPECIES: CBS domain-containing protein [Streptomyces]AQA13304.1 CBS domain-containing protein [Streptomyces autolyticus]ATL84592.1 putative signal transduction protein with CBS domains [Streptomyces malaysiensis]AUA12123.1 Hypoxic response protein 1 [Streptomyces sp. M56]MCC4321588.1 CBS domain-containing protein [Streptomyces malaysiensis]MCD9590777.1 CBS domain-containing protein [Streptomyces sp. 8ZJF_21]
MTKAADIMHPGAQWVSEHETVLRASQLMRDLGVGALPVSDANERLCGIVTDRDIVVGCIAESADPSGTPVGALTKGTPRWIPAEADVSDVLREMEEHRIRRLPVIDQNKRLVGMISEADLAHHLSDDLLGEFLEKVYAQ